MTFVFVLFSWTALAPASPLRPLMTAAADSAFMPGTEISALHALEILNRRLQLKLDELMIARLSADAPTAAAISDSVYVLVRIAQVGASSAVQTKALNYCLTTLMCLYELRHDARMVGLARILEQEIDGIRRCAKDLAVYQSATVQ